MKYFRSRAGQSLVEVVIGLAIGAVLMGTAAFAVTTMLRTNLTSEKSQFASSFAQALADNTRSYAAGNWDSIYGLTKSSSTHYFLNASGTTFFTVQGEEGMLDGDVVDGLVGQWKFDEIETSTSTTTYDATGNGNHGTLTNGVVRATSSCRISNCLSFDGVNDYVDGGTGTTLNVTSSLTLAAWVKPNTYVSGGTNTDRASIIQKTGQYYLTINSTTGTFDVYLQSITTSHLSSSSSVPLSTLSHISITYDGANIKWYLNGLLNTSVVATGTISSDPRSVRIGGEPSFGRFASSSIDDVRIYNRALSADEVKQLYNSGIYERFFTVENVCRTTDASSTISGTVPCGSGAEDISTQWLTSRVQWTTGAGTSEVALPVIVARSRNEVFRQTDWSGGVANEGAVVNPTGKYASSTNASTTGGRIQIQNLSQQ